MQQAAIIKPIIKGFFDTATNTISYVVSDPVTKKCAIIDSVADYEPHSATLTYLSAEALLDYIKKENLDVEWILETHIHADHITAATYLKEKTGAKIAMGKGIEMVSKIFTPIFFKESNVDVSSFDKLFNDEELFTIGNLVVKVMHVPGHTPADIAYLIGDAVFAGDTIFMPDAGSARCDFPGGRAETLYQSVHKLFSLPVETRLFVCHDYLPKERTDYMFETTIGEEKSKNIHLKTTITEEGFTAMREAKDKTLGMPRLIIPSIQANLRAGKIQKNNDVITLITPVNSIFSKP
jgi:glyoxylase-like metal-dependent hydrolase (beta-lactamase superfamily II)